MSCDNREHDVCDSNTNSIDDLDNQMSSKHGKLIDDLVSNIKSTPLASWTKLDSFSSPCELCDYDRDMAVQIKKHVESVHIDLGQQQNVNTHLYSDYISPNTEELHVMICGCGATRETDFSVL